MNENQTIDRRKALRLIAGGAAAALLAACTRSSDSPSVSAGSNSTATSSDPASGSSSTSVSAAGGSSPTAVAGAVPAVRRIPEETAGPYPGDGTNGPNALAVTGIARSDIRRSAGRGSAVADGVPLAIELTVVDSDTGKVLPGAAVYLWHCDRIGRYSMYSSGVGNENYLRGVQAADAEGRLRFTTVFPGAYDGRWPHIHFHVFDSAGEATNGRNARVTSQIALPASTCSQVYATSGYESSARNMSGASLSSDMVFRDGADLQLAAMSGSTSEGYTARLTVGV